MTRRIVDGWMPSAGHVYRLMRDKRAAMAPPIQTKFGFKFSGNRLMADGEFETEEVEVFLKYLKNSVACIDIGANVGFYTCLAAAHGKKVIAVEPLTSNLTALYQNIVVNGFEDVEVFPVALANGPGISRLHGHNTGASFLPGWAGASEASYELVPVSTLDLIVNTRFTGQTVLIKMDV
ncbi:MAG TPA: FkbM family methyltransferase, partial [Pseudolabrys sp.]|nr:FkbM family methyltransferase [Pseudolabrys sp.]